VKLEHHVANLQAAAASMCEGVPNKELASRFVT
jgi:hypothetical protein